MATFAIWLEMQEQPISTIGLKPIRSNADQFQPGQYVFVTGIGNFVGGTIHNDDKQGPYVKTDQGNVALVNNKQIISVTRPWKRGERILNREGTVAGTVAADNQDGLFVVWDGDDQVISASRAGVSTAPQEEEDLVAPARGGEQSVSAPIVPQPHPHARYIDPDEAGDSGEATPFMFDKKGNIHAFPNMGGTHDYWIDQEKNPEKRQAMYNPYYSGRIDDRKHTVSYWGSDYKGAERVGESLQKLLQQGLVNPKTWVSHPKLYGYTVEQVLKHGLGGTANAPVQDMTQHANDRRDMHVLSPFDPKRQSLQNRYGKKPMGRKNPWDAALQKTGSISPGGSLHRWTSESQYGS